jgi:hypothetical protein
VESLTRQRVTIRFGATQRTTHNDRKADLLRQNEGYPTEYGMTRLEEGKPGVQPHGNGTKKAGKR